MVKVVIDTMYAVILGKMWPVTTGAIEVKIGATFHQVSMEWFI